MKKIIILIAIVICLLPQSIFSQANGTVTLGPDIIQPSCKDTVVLHATTTSPLLGSSNYSINPIAYTPYSYSAGTNITSVSNSDDSWSTAINIPFPFCFFDNTYTTCVVGSNGALSFNMANAGMFMPWALNGVAPLPNTTFTAAQNSIMCPYQDIYPLSAGDVFYQTYGTAPNRVFVVSWNQCAMYSCTNLLANQQIALYETTNVIETYIGNKPECLTWNSGRAIHGIENSTGTIAFIVPGRNLPTSWTTSNDGMRFSPIGGSGGSAGITFEWYANGNLIAGANTDSLVVTPAVTTSYSVKATFNLCVGIDVEYDTINVIKQLPIDFIITNIKDPLCFAGTDGSFDVTTINGGPPHTLTLNNVPTNAGTQSGLVAGTYTITATDIYGCSNSTTVTINQPDKVFIAITEHLDVLCKYQNNGHIHLTASGGVPGYDYWVDQNMPPNTPSTNFNFDTLRAGSYMFYTQDSHACSDSIPVTITEPDTLLRVYQIAHEATCLNKKDGNVEAIASGGVPPYAYEWDSHPMQYTQTATDLETGAYHVLVTDANACIASTQIQVEQQLCCQLFMPTAFSPNGDTKNDIYRIIEYGGGITLGEFRIYNRWGQEVFSTRDLNTGWNGTFKGADEDPDTYHYIMLYTCNDKGAISQKIAKGDFILVR